MVALLGKINIFMSPDDIAELFRTMVDDQPDTAEIAMLMDAAYTKRNDARAWSFLIKLDTSISHLSSDTWQTTKTLPTDFEEPIAAYVGAGDNEYEPVPYEEVLRWISSMNRYTIDYANVQLRFMGPGNGSTMYLWYKMAPTSLIGLSAAQAASASTIVWPKRFCPILAFDMASMHMGGIDADEITRQQVPFLNVAHKELYNSMISWDTRRRMKMRGNSATQGRIGSSDRPDVVSEYP